jgi:hypothetical protein
VTIYEMDTFVAKCRTVEGALELAAFMERKFPLDSSSVLSEDEQLHKFIVAVSVEGHIEVHSTIPVNDLGREDFKKFVVEFTTLKMRKPVQRAGSLDTAARRVA